MNLGIRKHCLLKVKLGDQPIIDPTADMPIKKLKRETTDKNTSKCVIKIGKLALKENVQIVMTV